MEKKNNRQKQNRAKQKREKKRSKREKSIQIIATTTKIKSKPKHTNSMDNREKNSSDKEK